ncbi:hypothetical protein HPP92_003647 [Vanilla planifolia]|uniref:DIRP domain-containing protein n=1 Tax=Vanilla planifolia TaxID=51239 RepID=A0A835VJL9_VANPL|nr:hypothetical protein HPP92_003647 [Vanilla planifolia]
MSDFADVIALQTSKSSKRRSQQLFFGDESSALDALQTLADLSLNILLPASTIESELSIQVKEEKGAEAMDEKPSLPESLSTNLLKETINSSEWKDKGYSTAVDGAGRKSSKPSRGFAYGLNTSENKQQIGSSNSKIKKRKPKHTIETVVPEDGKRSTTKVKRVCQIPVPKHGKSSKLQEGHPTASDLERVMTNAPEAAAACSAGNDQILYTKVRNRRKSNLQEALAGCRLGHIPRLTRVEWGVIRSSLGKPRRLSYQFLKQEREKLEQYRESVRSHYSELRVGARDGLPTDLSRPLSVGQRVFACHPRSREVHDGSVLTVDRNRCRVQFDRPELGVEFVMVGSSRSELDYFLMMEDEQKEIKLRDSMKFSLAESLDVAEETSHADSYNYPMNTLMIQAKGDTLDAILQAKAAVNDVAVAAQHAMYNQPFTLAQIQA